jgi:hypothetical protein
LCLGLILDGAHDALVDVLGNVKLFLSLPFQTAFKANMDQCVVSLGQCVARMRARVFARARGSVESNLLDDIMSTLAVWEASAQADAELSFEWVVDRQVSLKQGGFFRAQVHKECERLGIKSRTKGKIRDPDAEPGEPAAMVGGHAVAINTRR